MIVYLEWGANDLHIFQLMPLPPHRLLLIKIQNGLIFLVLIYPGFPGKEAVKWVPVCFSDHVNLFLQSRGQMEFLQ